MSISKGYSMNKMFLILFWSASLPSYLVSMTDNETITLSEEETACYNWYKNYKRVTSVGELCANLTKEEREVFHQKMLYKDNPELVTRAINKYAVEFGKNAYNFFYDAGVLSSALLKKRKMCPKNMGTITQSLYVFSRLLPPEDQATIFRENYLREPGLAHQAVARLARSHAEEMAKLNLIENTWEAKAIKAQEFYQIKIAELEKAYNTKN